MTEKNIVKAVSLNLQHFPEVSNISINLYDVKEQIDNHDDVIFSNHLFEGNTKEGERFVHWLNDLEKNPVSSLNILVSGTQVIVFYKTSYVKIFSRIPSLEPIDYMG